MEFRKSQTIYMQIADHICENIMNKKVNQGDRIESVREMASNIQVNPNTVMRTFSYLQDQGIIFNKRGIGYFVADDAVDRIISIKKQDFVNNYLPEVFKMMDLLGISFKELEEIHKNKSKVQG